ncbi:MAG: type III-A CRISPR-associated protein Cas10/Csm1 [Rhodospirillaceae bacterium]|nr:type III-A CRISPR-associated protein Cas10/Csm1 [Rhodospirillaceae bacterium]
MTTVNSPSLDEVALGAFLEDIGKFMQRAHAGNAALPEAVMRRASLVLPGFQGRSTHWHALWTDAFFHALEQAGVALPARMNLDNVREVAVYHHRPGSALHWIAAEADRLSAGMDRKPKDEAAEEADAGGRDGFRRTPLRSVFAGIDLGRGPRPDPAACCYAVEALTPAALVPGPVDGKRQEQGYARLWAEFVEAFKALCRWDPPAGLFHEGLLSLSERYTWAIPSSTIDQPDVPLHDHDKSVAAIAACLWLFHRARGGLDDVGAIRKREIPKYRFLAGDLSGIQSTLFRLAAQQVKGGARILRARSFLLGAVVEAAALACRRKLGLPPYCLLQAAGGRFLMLVPDLDDLEGKIGEVRAGIDGWLRRRYHGDLALNLVLGPPVRGEDLMQQRFQTTRAALDHAVASAKQRPFAGMAHGGTGVIEVAYADRPDGACGACGVRPATMADEDDPEVRRCEACHDEYTLGRLLPVAEAVLWTTEEERIGGHGDWSAAMPCDLRLHVLREVPRADDRDAWRRVLSGWRIAGPGPAKDGTPLAVRHIANHVPRLKADTTDDPRYADLSDEARAVRAEDLKTFEHLAADAREVAPGDGSGKQMLLGRPMLAVLKADVDRLGEIFSRGLKDDRSLGRLAALSRLLDAFFCVVLPDLLRREFPNTYTVYAGGDDLLLVGPWTETIRLAARIGEAFRDHVGANPNVTLSAGVELCGVSEPLNRAVLRAEQRLEAAKDAGRDKVCLIDDTPVGWPQLGTALTDGEQVCQWMRDRERPLGTGFVHRALAAARDSHASAPPINWKARWVYYLGRVLDRDDPRDLKLMGFFEQLIEEAPGKQGRPSARPPATIPLTMALYRNR